jgi:hypothetical protein
MPINFPTFTSTTPFFGNRLEGCSSGRYYRTGCHSADYFLSKATLMPVEKGGVLAVLDSGAYFFSSKALSVSGSLPWPQSGTDGIAFTRGEPPGP